MADTKSDGSDGDLKPRELMWRRHNLAVELYKFYWNGLLQLNTLLVAFAGGLVAYVLVNSSVAPPLLRWSLVLPAATSLAQVVILVTGWGRLSVLGEELREVAKYLDIKRYPSVLPLQVLVAALVVVHCVVAVGLPVLVACLPGAK